MDTLGIYIQVPFCQTKCTYCNFHTGVVSRERFAPYVGSVCREIDQYPEIIGAAGINSVEQLRKHTVDTIYIGGGTPSLLDPSLLAMLLRTLRDNFSCVWDEVTLEADPETVNTEKSGAWAGMGINRISLGTQSFVDEELRAAGRMHRRADIYSALSILRDAGIRNVSFDLIAGLPKQTLESWQRSLAELIALAPEHVSVYMMEIDEGSRLGLEVLQGGTRYSARDLPDEEIMAEFYETAQAELKTAGYAQYEISNWAKPGFESRHNIKYWRRQPYLGFGAGAHSFSGGQRWANAHNPAVYAAKISAGQSAAESVEAVTPESALEEELFLGLRQLAGIDLRRIQHEYHVDLGVKVGRLKSAGMVELDGDILRLAPEKLSISNEAIVELLR